MAIQKFIQQCLRVLRTTKKPNRKEYNAVAKISGIGILLIGLLGFTIFVIQSALL